MSGPDGFMTNATTSFQPGGTYASPATPMTDFPVANANADTMFILGMPKRATFLLEHFPLSP